MARHDEVLIALRQIIRATDLYSRKLSKVAGLTAPHAHLAAPQRWFSSSLFADFGVAELCARLQGPVGSPLFVAAENGHTDVVKLLLAKGADAKAKDEDGRTPGDLAIETRHPMCLALVEPELAKTKGDELMAAFASAKHVHVISTRFRRAKGLGERGSNDPWTAAATVKLFLEEARLEEGHVIEMHPEPDTRVFNPNADNAFLMAGNSESANAIWLRNWREVGLTNAQKTGGWCAATARIAPSTHTRSALAWPVVRATGASRSSRTAA